MKTTRKPELLAPGGSFSKAMTALEYGADAVYVGGTSYGLRSAADNLSLDELRSLVGFADTRGKKVYVTLNVLPRSSEIPGMCEYARTISEIGVHGAIVSDIGAFAAIRRAVPSLPLHVSTQANNLNADTCLFWHGLGASRINLARELTLDEIREIHNKLETVCADPPELEIFVHGAMCMAYSGRCMLSDYLAGRSSNRGECAQPCRWKYFPSGITAEITEEKRPGQVFTVEEHPEGTFLFNSRDLCLLEYLPELTLAGASAFKIEGRMKSDFYVAVTVRAYRRAVDAVWEDIQAGGSGKLPPELLAELYSEVCSVSHRDYSYGFLLGERGSEIFATSSYIRETVFAAVVEDCARQHDGRYLLTLSQRGNFGKGDTLEFVAPDGPVSLLPLTEEVPMTDADGLAVSRAPHACMTVHIVSPFPASRGTMVRYRKHPSGNA